MQILTFIIPFQKLKTWKIIEAFSNQTPASHMHRNLEHFLLDRSILHIIATLLK